jgi:hypothetical protein
MRLNLDIGIIRDMKNQKMFLSSLLSLSLSLSSLSPAVAGMNVENQIPRGSENISQVAVAPLDFSVQNLSDFSGLESGLKEESLPNLESESVLSPLKISQVRVQGISPADIQKRGQAPLKPTRFSALLGRLKKVLGRGVFKTSNQSIERIDFDGRSGFSNASLGVRQKPWQNEKTFPALDRRFLLEPPHNGIVSLKEFHLSANPASPQEEKPLTLNADPADMASIEKALRQEVDSNPEKYGLSNQYGTPNLQMATVHVVKLAGQADQADSIIAVFRQWQKGVDRDGSPYYLLVDGADLRFHIKVLNDKPIVMGIEGGFTPGIDPAIMKPEYDDNQLEEIARKQLSVGPSNGGSSADNVIRPKAPGHFNLGNATPQVVLMAREIVYFSGSWRAMNIYQGNSLSGMQKIILVDVKTGEAFPLGSDGILNRYHASADNSVSGAALGRGTLLTDDGQDHGPIGEMPLPNAKIFDSQGRVIAVTDENGNFKIAADANGGKPMPIVVRLDGIYGPVIDDDSSDPPIVANLTVKPGETVRVTVNPSGDNEQAAASVNAYVYSYRLFNWFKSYLGLSDPRFYVPLAGSIHTNGTSLPGNADYDPMTDGFYLMKRATLPEKIHGKDGQVRTVMVTFENTSQPSISLHELGHRFVQRAAQLSLTDDQMNSPAYRFVKNPISPVMGSGSNEATADTISMFMRNSPVIGNGFILNPLPGMPTIIRTGENKTAYDSKNPDPHNQGETQMGTAWMSRKDIMAAMGEAEGAFRSALIFVLAQLYAQPEDPVSALTHALLADMSKDGNTPHEAIIRSHAKNDHGLDLPASPSFPASQNLASKNSPETSPAGKTVR